MRIITMLNEKVPIDMIHESMKFLNFKIPITIFLLSTRMLWLHHFFFLVSKLNANYLCKSITGKVIQEKPTSENLNRGIEGENSIEYSI